MLHGANGEAPPDNLLRARHRSSPFALSRSGRFFWRTAMNRCKCGEAADFYRHTTPQCVKHYRIRQMRHAAKGRGRYVPTTEELERLFDSLVDFRCPHCSRRMDWTNKDGPNVVTLQHDDSGTIRLLCMPCNSRHRDIGDAFYDRDPNQKVCNACNRTLLDSSFRRRNRGRNSPLHGTCRECMNVYHAAWRASNKDRRLPLEAAAARRRRARKKESREANYASP